MILCFNYILDIQDSLICSLLFEGNLLSKEMTGFQPSHAIRHIYRLSSGFGGTPCLKLLELLRTAEMCA